MAAPARRCYQGRVSSPFRTPLSATLIVAGAGVGLTGIALWVRSAVAEGGPFDGRVAFLLLALAGLALEMAGFWVHDRGHRRRGEIPHALWGLDDRNRPDWIPRRDLRPRRRR